MEGDFTPLNITVINLQRGCSIELYRSMDIESNTYDIYIDIIGGIRDTRIVFNITKDKSEDYSEFINLLNVLKELRDASIGGILCDYKYSSILKFPNNNAIICLIRHNQNKDKVDEIAIISILKYMPGCNINAREDNTIDSLRLGHLIDVLDEFNSEIINMLGDDIITSIKPIKNYNALSDVAPIIHFIYGKDKEFSVKIILYNDNYSKYILAMTLTGPTAIKDLYNLKVGINDILTNFSDGRGAKFSFKNGSSSIVIHSIGNGSVKIMYQSCITEDPKYIYTTTNNLKLTSALLDKCS